MNKKLSDKDKRDWQNFLQSKEKLQNKDTKIKISKSKITRTLDLHGQTLDQANLVVEDFINKSYENGISKLIIVTGKGLHSKNESDPYVSKELGILRYSIPEFLRNNLELMKIISNISKASVEDGGSGAFYIFLKKKIIYIFHINQKYDDLKNDSLACFLPYEWKYICEIFIIIIYFFE